MRQAPDRAGLFLDPEGFVRMEDLVGVLQRTTPEVSVDVVHAVVAMVEPHKKRYSVVDDCVRANYGHSTADHNQHASATPPDVLFHGTGMGAARPGVGAIGRHGAS